MTQQATATNHFQPALNVEQNGNVVLHNSLVVNGLNPSPQLLISKVQWYPRN